MSVEQYENVCREEFSVIKKSLEQLDVTIKASDKRQEAAIERIYKVIWVGNGHDSHAVQLAKLNSFVKLACWVGGALCVSWLGIMGKLIYEALRH